MAGNSNLADRVEWVLGAASAAVVLAIVGFFVWQGLGETRAPARLSVAPVAAEAGNELRFAVRNDGGRTATGVVVRLRVRSGDRVLEERRLTLDYLPGHSEVMGAFALAAAGDAVELSVEGYVDP